MDASKETVFQTEQDWHTCGRAGVAAFTKPTVGKPGRGSALRETEVGIGSHPFSRSSLQLVLAGKGKVTFLQWSLTVYISHILPRNCWPTQNKLNAIFCRLFVSFYFVLMKGFFFVFLVYTE